MAENVQRSIEVPVPLQLFGSLVTEMNAADLPEGTSPDNQDVVFTPGAVASRPCLHKWLLGLPSGTTITYEKTFITPKRVNLNLILTSDGQFWVQDTSNPPYLPQLLGNVAPGSYANSVTAFGKELITFNDNLSGTDIPRTYDGEFFDRATQYGPGAPPLISNVILPAVNMTTTPTTSGVSISTIHQSNPVFVHGELLHYSTLEVTTVTPHGLSVGDYVVITGSSEPDFNTDGTVPFVLDEYTFKVNCILSIEDPPATGGTVTATSGISLVRSLNTVTCSTVTAHSLLKGFQVQISGMDDSVVGGSITQIVIDNENNPGVATVTTAQPHGLVPQNIVNILNVNNAVVGGAISGMKRSANVVTASTNTNNGLSIGAYVTISGVSDDTFNGLFLVSGIISPNIFTYDQVDVDKVVSAPSGTVSLNWIPNTPGLLENYYTVITSPTTTTFEIQVSYNDGTWTSGKVTFSWNGIFYVTNIISPTSFQYQQYGPNATTTQTGIVTPHSQIAPGTHQCVVLFETRMGYVTAPSPPVQFIANGSQYLYASNIPLGPPNVVKRYLAFTGSGGNNFFYIPVPAFVNGITVSTSTAIVDNTTTNLLMDFSDNTLFDSIAIDIKGNNLFQMAVLGRPLSVAKYASRSAWYGMKNYVPNFLNLGFEGGYISGDMGTPLGWTVVTPGGVLQSGNADFGYCWAITGSGTTGAMDGEITQSAYQDAYGIPIFNSGIDYTVEVYLSLVSGSTSSGGIVIDLYSPSLNTVYCQATIPASTIPASGKFFSVDFGAELPFPIAPDTVLRVYGFNLPSGTTIGVDEIEFYPTDHPDVPKFLYSYVNSPESLDSLTGVLGAADDTTPIQTYFEYRDSFLFLTCLKLHETNDLAGYEPSEWRVREISSNCGACSPNSCSTGENFSVWMTSPSSYPPVGRGLYIYTGGQVYKLSQEIQPDFDAITKGYQKTIWVTNDAVTRRIYIGVPYSGATAPNRIYVMDYREMDSALQIAEKPPIHISFSGKMICSDLSRKWTKWNIQANCGGIIYVPTIGLQFCVGSGNGQTPGLASGFATSYWFDLNKYTDDDYGQVSPYYTTYFFINHEMEMNMQVGAHRKLYKRYAAYITGVGRFQLTPYANELANPWPSPPIWPLQITQAFDIGDGLNVSTERCAFKIASVPVIGQTDNSFNLAKFIPTLCQEPVSPIRFGAV
jgi:hypothetical protein